MGAVAGVRALKEERRAQSFGERLEQAHLVLELQDLEAAGVSRRAQNLWRLRGEGRDPKAIAQQLEMTLAAVQKSLQRSSQALFEYRRTHLPEITDPADYEDGTSYRTWVAACAELVIERALRCPEPE